VLYVDAQGREFEQPAEVVVLCAYGLWNVHLLLVSGIGEPYDPATGEGVVGRNYAYQTMSSVSVFFDHDVNINPFMGAGALGTVIDDFNGDNFDHAGWASWAAPTSPATRPAGARSSTTRCPPVRNAGAGVEAGGRAALQPHGGRAVPRLVDGPPRTTTCRSIRRTRTPTAGRCCG
jgi:gluconate 2-dehydrogenase alpha chain